MSDDDDFMQESDQEEYILYDIDTASQADILVGMISNTKMTTRRKRRTLVSRIHIITQSK